MSVRRFIQQREESQETDANAGDEDSRQPLDLANDRDLPIERQEFEEEEEIPLRARQIGGVGWVGFGFGRNTDKGGEQNQNDKNAQRHDQVFEDAIGPEEFAVIAVRVDNVR